MPALGMVRRRRLFVTHLCSQPREVKLMASEFRLYSLLVWSQSGEVEDVEHLVMRCAHGKEERGS